MRKIDSIILVLLLMMAVVTMGVMGIRIANLIADNEILRDENIRHQSKIAMYQMVLKHNNITETPAK